MLGFNGIATFNRADNVRGGDRPYRYNRFAETDAPYLTPVPYRGRPCAPCYLPLVAKVAEVKQLDVELMLQTGLSQQHGHFFGSG